MSMIDWLRKAEAHEARLEPGPDTMEGRVIEALRTVYDPEIPVNIYDLGLVYSLSVDEAAGKVGIRMTLTAPGCPVAQTFPGVVESAVMEVGGVDEVEVELVWDPPWSRERMSEAARLELGLL
ncbi:MULTISPECIES: SUF system Fe-S cluster assembly protein [unclassified Cupriavidus]|uniref:SUF system Fe-S cluster assembly protein n=1 Tax=Cupriavidus TaxID=106589 RepID=UPI00227021AF|nr:MULTISPECIES: SUF system Fe-S cluster assembly protein [unclassified Cupriavidus]MCY0854559.1 SUF system Fe-S cluster assembly protein [Cupriavidus sp. D39]MDW3686722.1 SUF system Fe-S cluster assembly protein [Cupriavidus sp. CV2]